MAAGAYGLTWLAILMSVFQVFLITPSRSWAVTGGTTLTVVPVAPNGLTASDRPADEGGAINLSWTPSTSTGVTEQRIYRGTTLGGPYPTLATTITNNTTSTYTDSTGLTNGTTYYYVVRAFGGGQESGNSNEANAVPSDNTAPVVPTSLVAADVAGDNGGAIVLNWTLSTSTDVTQQRIYRGTTLGGPYGALVTTISNNTTSTYTNNTGLTNGTTYYYVVRAYDGTQESANSNEANAVPIDNPPGPPTGLSAADVAGDNGGAIVLNWALSTAGDVTQQRIYRGTATGGPYATLVTTIANNTTSTYTNNTGLTNGTTYYYVIRAYDGTQESANSNESSATPVDNTAPSAPTTLSAADVAGDNGGAIVLNWTPSVSGDVTQQRIYRGTATGGPYGTLVTTISNNTTSIYTNNTGLTNGTTYYYVIRAYDGTQESVNSNESSAVPVNNPSNPPTGLSAADVAGDNGGAIALNWTLSTSLDVTQQRIYRGIATGGPYGTLVTTITNNTTSTYTDNTGLTNGTTYYYVIRAYDGTQESVNSNESSAAPVDNTAPAAPTTLLAADVAGDNGGAIVLNWALSTAGDVTQQRIYRGTATGGPYGTLVTTIPNNTTVTYTDNTGLTNGTTYYYVIRAYDGTQESANSNESSAAPIDNTAPAAPTTLLAADVAGDNGGAIVLNWALSTAGDVTQQRIYRGTATGGPYGTLVTTIPNNTTSTYTDNTGLTNGTTYYYVIRAYDGTQESGNSNQASAVPIDNTAPGAPTTLLAADVAGDNGGAIVLNWTLSASSDVTQQRLYRGIVSGGPYGTLVTTITNNTTSTYTDNTGLTNGTTYYYVIRAYDGTQESANSNQTSAVPIGDIASATNSVIAATSPVYADGVSVSTVTVTVKDNTNNPVAGATVTLSSSRGAADTITQPAGTTAINGQITGTVRSSTPGDSVISAIANGTINLVNTATINFYNTPAGSNVLVSPITSTEVTFTTVTGVGTTSAQQNPTGTPMPSGYITPTYYDISTTAAYTGTVSICITYNEAQYLGNESRVKLLHYETSAWVDRTSGPVDTVNNKVCGNVTSFSEFATGEATVPTITTAFLPDGTASASYSATLTASGGILPLTWSILTGSLPAGLSLNASTGVISGTPTTAGTSNFTVRVTDSNNATNDKALSIMIYSAISITTTSLPDGTAGAAYNQTVSATGGKTPYSWSIIAGSLPAGLSLNASTGVISGTPSVTGTSNFTIQVQDANSAVATQALSIAIYSPLSITTTALADGTVSVAYSQTLSATGGKTPYTWSITSGSLPAGLTLNPGTGVISGTPTATGASNFTVQVTDANSQIASRALSITIYSGVAITTAALPDGTVSLAYNTTLTATGGATPYTWSITLGALPPGLSLNPSTGLINGTPTASGTYPITVQVTDNNLVTNTKNLSITIFSAISVATSSLTDGTVNATYSQTLTASGGKTPYTWSITAGTLPSGLSLNSSTGVVSGTPSVSGTSNFTTQVTDANGATATRALSITIFSAISITTTSLPDGTVNLAYSQTLASSGGKTPYTWSIISGALPAGLSLNSITGAITGTPTASGASTFTAQVTDANGATATQALTITIYAVVTITTTTLPDGTVGAAYSTTVNVSGGKNPLVWGLSSGVLPTGLTINSSTGAITGNPTASGTYNFTIQVTDANGAVATQAYTITIYAAISITTTSLADGTVNASYSQTLTVSGGKSPFTWTLSGGALPAGLALAGSTGVISGTPTVAGTSNFTVQATDSNGATAPRVLSITIYPALSMTTNALSDGTVSLAYSQTLVASGGKSPLSWSITAGALPTGLGLAGGTGVISGTPTAAGTFNFTVQVTDANGAVASRALSIVIYSAISVTTTSLADGTVGVAYSQTVSASGGKTPYNWSIPSGSLPTGLSLNNGTGGISGTPTVAGTSNFTIRATDANGATADQALSIAVYNPLSVTTTALASGTINLAYSQTLVASGGKTPYNWSVIAGTLPTGLSLAGGTGVISGTPTVTGTWNFTVQAADSGGRTTGQALSITIYSGLTITTASLSDGTVTASYSATLAASGGQSPYTWAITVGILPSGLTLNGSTGVISGTPALAGSYPITVQVTDSNLSTQTKDFTITIYGAVSVTTAALSDGTVNAAYSQTLAASGGKTPYTWSITLGSLPTGLVLNGVSGGISGTPSASGTFNFTVQVTDANGAVASRALSILVYSAISVTTTALSDGTVNLAYSQTLSVSGGKTPLTWSISTGTLPAGLSLAGGTGVISGTPTTAGTSNFTVQVVDANGAVATRALSIVIYGAVSVTTASLPDGMVGSSYSQTLSAAGGKTPYAWNISVGSLPAGLGLNGSTGAISGIPTAAGTSNFTIQVTDANGATAAQALSVTVYATLTVTTSALPDGTVNLAYNATMTATGGKAPVGWSITVGVLPAGLSLNGSTGVISGTPTTASTSNITVRVTDANGFISDRSLSITIYGAISISTTSLPDGTVNGGYSATVVGIGGKTPYSWSITLGALPAGLALNSSTGVISGVPTTAGTSNFTVQVTDNNSATATQALSITIYSALSINTTSLSDGTVSLSYTQTLTASGGKTPYVWSIATGSFPAGLSLNTSTGVISGTPTTAGTSNFTVRVTDANSAQVSQALSIVIYPALSITTTSLADGTVNLAYSQTLASSGGKSPIAWSITLGSLPAGLSLNGATGVVSGTPITSGTSNFTVQAADANGATATQTLSITIYASLSITTAALSDGTVSFAYSQTLTAGGGKPPLSWTVTLGTLPLGLTLNGSTGVISGTPTTAGTNNFTVQVTDANSATTTRALSITIYSAISLVTTSLNNGTVGAVYSQTITASGGKTPYTWNITAGNLPPGLALNASTGVLSGTPTTAGTYNFTAQVMDANGAAASNPLSIIIYSGLSITTTSLSDGTVNLAYSQTLAVGGGSSPYTWSIIVGSLPAGLTLNSGTGVISGTPTTAGTSNFTVQVTDINSAVATRSLSITIYVALSITTASLPAGTRTAAYSQTIAASGGKTPYAWSVTTGALPAGLALNSATGQISGTPTAAGISNFTIQVSDANGATDSRAFSITINDVPTITTASLSGGTAGTAYSQTLTSSGGTSPLTWSLTLGSLPVGLTLNVSTGVLSGTPTLSATYNFTITLTDSYSVSDSRPYSINIVPGVPAKANILASKTTIVANGTDSAALTVTVRDANDNLVTDGTTVTVTTTNGTVTGITTTLNGVVSRTITGTVSGAAVLGVESPTGTALSTVTGNTSLSFIPGPPAQANIAASKTTVIADGVDQTVLTITVRDANGNLVSDGTTVTLTTALGTVTGTGNTVNGVVTRYLSSIATGTAALGVQSPTGTILASVAGNTSITFSSGVPARAVIAASATTLIANGVDSSTLTVTVYDANNNLVTNGTTVTVTTTLGTVTGTGTTVNGVVTRTITGTISGTAVLGVQSPTGTTLTNVTGNTTIVFNPGPPAQSNISASKTTIIADGVDSTTLTITVRDATGNLVTDGTTVLLTTSLGTVTGSGATALGVVTRVLSGTVSGTANLGVESPVGTPLATVTGNTAIILQPGLPAGTIALSPSPASIVANGVSISTVTSGVIRDAYNNPVLDGTLITVATNRGSITTADASGVNPGIQVTTVSGVTSFVVQSGTLIGTANITAVSVAGSATGNTQIAFVAGTPSAANSSMIAMSPVYSDGVSASTVTITVRDIYNNPVTGSTVVLSSSRGGLDLITQPAGVTDGNGQIIGTVASTSTGDAVITATVNGSVVLTQTATINFYNTQTGTNVTVSASNNTSVTFDMVITIGITTSTQNGTGTALPAGYANPSYFDISTTATFSGNVTICITYNEATYAVREGLVKILHKEGGVLIDRTTFVNTATNTVCGVVTSFSEFAIASTAATNLQVTTLSQAVVSGDVSSVVQVEAKDNNGATDTGYSGTANVSSNSSTLRVDANSNGTFSQTSISINIVNGVGTFYFKDTVVGTPTITVTDAAVILSPASQQETITPAAPSGVITLTPVPGSIVADGAATSTVTSGVIRDVYGNSVSNGTLITVATNLGTITTADVSGTYSGIQLATVNGVISFVVQSGTWVGTANVTAAGVQGSASGNTQIIFLPGLPSGAITLSPTPGSIVADGTATSTVTSGVITDVNGNTVSNGTLITVATDRGTITTADVSGADPGIQVATVSGVISYVVRSGTVSGIANVTAASVQGSASGNAQIIFLPGLPSGTITLTPSPASIIADGAATSTVTSGVITDVYGNTVSDGTLITVATDRGTITTADASGAYAGTQVATISGAISFVVRSGTVSGTANVTAASVAGSAAGSTTIAFISGLPYGTINLTPNPAIIPADGVSTSIITSGVITDINGNTVSDGTLITVATDRGTITTADAGGAYTGVQVTTNSGIITFTLRAGTTEGIATVTAISVQGSANGQATVTLTNVPPELNYPFETGYGNGDAIDPDSGIRSSVYTYKIIYRDVNNNPPAYIRLCIDSSPCTAMGLDTAAIDPSLRDGNYDNGEQYLYTINTLNSGDHAYYIETSDGLAYTKLPPAGSLNGPYVNYPPELSYSLEPGYVTDGVDPDTGNITATFNFKVVYRDLDNQAPASIRVCIDGICYAMSLDASASATLRDSDYRNYEQYVYSTLLSDGTHNYYFDTSDSLEGALLPTSGNLIGPIVTNTYTPVGTNVVVRPDPDVTVTFTQVTAIGDTYVTRSQTGSPLPSGYLQGIPPAYFDIWTTATYTGKVKICYTYDDIQYFGIGYGGERGLRLLHYESGSFKDRTVVLDVNNNMVCGEVYSFSEFSAAVEQATLVTLTSFMAMGMNGKVLLTWATASEVDSMGFNILRGASPDGPFTRINDWVIRSKGTSTRGMAYTYEDIDVKNGTTYFYRLENVDINGRIAAHMIASATLAAPPLAEEKPQSSETLSSAAPGPETAPPGEEILTGHPAPEAPAGGIIYREIPAVIGGEPPPAISEPPVNSAEGENIVPETDTGKEAVEAMPRIGDRVPEERRGISEPEAPEGKRGAPKGFTLKIADDEGNEMEVSLPEETENVQEPFELTVAENNKISLRWSAKGNLKGFNVLRGEGKEKAKEYIRVNVLPIPFFASQSGDQGLVYHFKDAGAGQGKVYSYKVETIFSDGTSRESRSIEISILGTGNAN